MQEAVEEVYLKETEDTMKDKYLTFIVGREEYGIELKHVREIIGLQEIIEVPGFPRYIKGVINLRGKIISLMDVRLRFNKQPQAYSDRTCIIVIDVKDVSIGLIVDSVSEVLSILEDSIVPQPQTERELQHKYISGIGKVGEHVKLLIDCERLLSNDNIDDLI